MENVIQIKSYAFSLNIVRLFREFNKRGMELTLARQLLRSGTSVGANISEMIGSQSDKDFLSKSLIAYKEARESIFWLKLLRDSEYLDAEYAEKLMLEAEEICRILGRIRTTINKKLNPN